MKTRFVSLIIMLALLAFASIASAAPHTVKLTWADDQTGVTYNVYRATGACSSTPLTFAKVNTTPVTVKTFTDSTASVGRFCYRVTAFADGLESLPSNHSPADITPFPPTGLTNVIDIAVTVFPNGKIIARVLVNGKPIDMADDGTAGVLP